MIRSCRDSATSIAVTTPPAAPTAVAIRPTTAGSGSACSRTVIEYDALVGIGCCGAGAGAVAVPGAGSALTMRSSCHRPAPRPDRPDRTPAAPAGSAPARRVCAVRAQQSQLSGTLPITWVLSRTSPATDRIPAPLPWVTLRVTSESCISSWFSEKMPAPPRVAVLSAIVAR